MAKKAPTTKYKKLAKKLGVKDRKPGALLSRFQALKGKKYKKLAYEPSGFGDVAAGAKPEPIDPRNWYKQQIKITAVQHGQDIQALKDRRSQMEELIKSDPDHSYESNEVIKGIDRDLDKYNKQSEFIAQAAARKSKAQTLKSEAEEGYKEAKKPTPSKDVAKAVIKPSTYRWRNIKSALKPSRIKENIKAGVQFRKLKGSGIYTIKNGERVELTVDEAKGITPPKKKKRKLRR